MALSPTVEKFVLHWGEMGSRWGINRTMAQIHALLYLSERPLHAEEICETLGVARSHVSNSLRELQGWGIVRLTHVLGDRRDHFESMTDVWDMFLRILDERKKRECDPTLALLRECVRESTRDRAASPVVTQRLEEMASFFETMTGWYGQVRALPRGAMLRLFRMGSSVRRLLKGGSA